MKYTVSEWMGDGISPELATAVHGLAARLPVEIEFDSVDLTLARRERDAAAAYDQAEESLRRHRSGLKYPTTTKGESPNAVLRERCRFSVIHRPVVTVPGVEAPIAGRLHLDIVRVARGGTYADPGRRISEETAVSLRVVERRPSREAARYAFELARRTGRDVVSTSKYTIQAATDGLFEEAVDFVARDFPTVPRRRELFDALLAKLVLSPERFGVIVTLNEYGDFLSDLACGLAGSIGLGASANFSFTDEGRIELALFDPAGGTAPDIAGQDVANPTAAFLAFGMLLSHLGRGDLGRAVEEATYATIAAGRKTRDIGGQLKLSEFTSAVGEALAERVARLNVAPAAPVMWSQAVVAPARR